MLYMATPSMG